MDRVILIKYGELSTKKGNRGFFVRTLKKNIEHKLKNYSVRIENDLSRMYIYFKEEDFSSITNEIRHIFGIHMYHLAYIADTNVESILKVCLDALRKENFHSFKVETKRSDKSFPYDSPSFSKWLGGEILKHVSKVTVDVHHPDLLVQVEIREKHSYLYFNSYQGLGGYPVGTQPRGLLMLSGGIDSPVAGYLSLKRGIQVDAVYFEAIPHTSLDARNKVVSLVKKLTVYADKISLHIVNFTPIQEEIYKTCDSEYVITIMRRMMYRIMEELCHRKKALAIINGESIGQVASQTLHSMNVINSVTNMPVIRPVSCMDKLEIIDIAKKIDTYETSILPYEDCCTVFVPKHPIIHPNLEHTISMEKKIDYSSMIQEAVDSVETILVTNDSSEFSQLL